MSLLILATETPAPDADLAEQTVTALWGVALSIGASAVVIVLVGWLVLHASKRPFPSSVVTSLTILAALSLIGYAIGGEARPELAAIAGTAVGALAGATTSLLAGRGDRGDGDAPDEPLESH